MKTRSPIIYYNYFVELKKLVYSNTMIKTINACKAIQIKPALLIVMRALVNHKSVTTLDGNSQSLP